MKAKNIVFFSNDSKITWSSFPVTAKTLFSFPMLARKHGLLFQWQQNTLSSFQRQHFSNDSKKALSSIYNSCPMEVVTGQRRHRDFYSLLLYFLCINHCEYEQLYSTVVHTVYYFLFFLFLFRYFALFYLLFSTHFHCIFRPFLCL